MSSVKWLQENESFQNPLISGDPDPTIPGLIAVSERIYPGQLIAAYKLGIFPWYSDRQPVLWWSPNPRMVLNPNNFKVSKSLKKIILQFYQNPDLQLLVDHNFEEVIRACSDTKRINQDGTWITEEMIDAYTLLHNHGYAHSISIFHKKQLIGGLYCVSIGATVFGESMFSRQKNTSKLALAALCAWCKDQGIQMIDCQQETAHLKSLGAESITRDIFLSLLHQAVNKIKSPWNFNKEILGCWL